MIRLRKLLATALLTIPVLVFSAAAPTAGASPKQTLSSAPTICYNIGGHMYCF